MGSYRVVSTFAAHKWDIAFTEVPMNATMTVLKEKLPALRIPRAG